MSFKLVKIIPEIVIFCWWVSDHLPGKEGPET